MPLGDQQGPAGDGDLQLEFLAQLTYQRSRRVLPEVHLAAGQEPAAIRAAA